MLFQHVSIAGLAHIDAPNVLSSEEINLRLKPTLDRLGIKTDVLRDVAGIHSRRLWDEGTAVADAATDAARKALAEAAVDPAKIGILINTSVSRDFLEPSVASIVSGQLGLSDTCQNFDVANACLAFINGMDIAGRMIALLPAELRPLFAARQEFIVARSVDPDLWRNVGWTSEPPNHFLDFDAEPIAVLLSDRAGQAVFNVPQRGRWQLNVIWTKPIRNTRADFETIFSSLTLGYDTPRPAA
jgi:3-oxoacyl-[acyl-carrier-protein] synthase III